MVNTASVTQFRSAWWLRSPHLQTLWPVYFKKRFTLDLVDEQVELDDGDFLDIHWSKQQSDKVVLILHGLEGSINSQYANSTIHHLEQAGFRAVFMHFRGCSGRPNRLPRAYHSGDTGDLAFIIEHIKVKTGRYPYAVVGFSLGGNVLLKWLGETGAANPAEKAVAVSVPFRLHDAAARLEMGASRIYRNHLMKSLRQTYLDKFKDMASPLEVDVHSLRSFWEYDDKVTAPLHGFSGAQEYYDRCSSRQYLKDIKTPTRIIHSKDDPFMFESTVPGVDELSKDIDFILTGQGGHVGFVSADDESSYWFEHRIIDFLKAV